PPDGDLRTKHPGVLWGWRSEDGNEVKILAEHRVVIAVALKRLVGFHNLLDLLESSSAESGGNQGERGGPLRGAQFSHAEPSPVDDGVWEIRPEHPLLLVIIRE